jgi:hypothetical protein
MSHRHSLIKSMAKSARRSPARWRPHLLRRPLLWLRRRVGAVRPLVLANCRESRRDHVSLAGDGEYAELRIDCADDRKFGVIEEVRGRLRGLW